MFEEISNLSDQIEAFLNSASSEIVDPEPQKSSRKEVKGTYFACVLYPDEDMNHLAFFNYVIFRPSYECVWIKHDRDKDKDGSPLKPHIHIMIHTLDRMAVGSFVKFFDPWISYAECINFPKSYVMYMLHDTPQAIMEGKVPYTLKDLHGSEKLWRHLVQNSNFVQLEEVLSYHHDGATYLDTYNNIPLDRKAVLGPFMIKNYYFVRGIINDENQKFFRWCEWQNMRPFIKEKNESED